MSLSSPEKSREAALKAANMMRALLDLPPVDHLYPGYPLAAMSCAITETVYDDDLDRKEWEIMTGGGQITAHKRGSSYYINSKRVELREIPGAISFIKRFDKREFPDLIKGHAIMSSDTASTEDYAETTEKP